MNRQKYNIGLRFNNFILSKKDNDIISKNGVKYTAWKCICDCGCEFTTTTKAIKKGRKSCGCLSKSNRFKLVSDKEYFTNLKIGHYKYSAEKRNIKWGISKDYFFELITNNCYFCGSLPSLENKRGKHKILLNGIDRLDNTKDYVIENVVSCCRFCNYAKSNSTLEDFKLWIKRLIKYQINENNNNI